MFPTTGGGDQVSNAFAPIYSMIGGRSSSGGTQITGGGSGAFGLQPQGIQGNDLTQSQRASMNLLGNTGAQLGQLGQGVLGAGMQGAETGFGTMGTALETLNDPLNYWKAIMSGDPTATAAALGPTGTNLSQIFSGATNQASQGMPQGGYRAATLAGLPQQQAAQIGNALLQLQPTAATNLADISSRQGQIGSAQGQLGLGVGGLGTQLTGQGGQLLQAQVEDILRKMGINIEGGTANLFGKVAQGIGQIAGGVGGALLA